MFARLERDHGVTSYLPHDAFGGMDPAVHPAIERGEIHDDPEVRATQERLAACSHAMAHPETGRLVRACAQHSVLDPEENRELAVLLAMAGR